jgi:hypothetical protein
VPLSDIISREYAGRRPAPAHLAELCFLSEIVAPLESRQQRLQYRNQLVRVHAERSLTGRLVLAGGYALHLLEGPFGVLEERFGELCVDAHFANAKQLILRATDARRFADWYMYTVDLNERVTAPSRIEALARLCRGNMNLGGVAVLEAFLEPG